MIPRPIKMLVSWKFADELVARLPKLFGPEAKFRSALIPKASELAWANSLIGFDLPPQLDTSHLQWVHCWGAGVEQWLAGRLSPQCLLTRTVGNMDFKIAEFCLAYSLSQGLGLFQIRDNQAKHIWVSIGARSLKNQHVAVLGAGAIGGEICRLYRSCGAEVSAYGRSGSATVSKMSEFHRQAAQFDILIACLPKTPATRNLIDAELLGQCRLQQFINVGRSDTVNTDDLLGALASGHIKQVILDVFATEPLPENSPLWNTEGLLISPHRSGPTETEDILDSLRELLAAGPGSRLVVDRSRCY